jgi:predicted Fe-S protein YdhL (DUF1289 family)
MATVSSLPSPCIRNCCLDEKDVCLGCGRTLAEIRDWSTADDLERSRVLERAAVRRGERAARLGNWLREPGKP